MTFKVKDGIAIGTTNIFDSTGKLLVNAPTANALVTAVNIAATGDVTANIYSTFGSNTSAAFTLANSGATAGLYGGTTAVPVINVDSKGRITSVANASISIGSSVLTIAGNTGGTDTVNLGVDTLTVQGSGGISTTITNNTIGINVDSTVALRNDTHYIGTTATALNRASANQALTGILSVSLAGSGSGATLLQPSAAASGTLTLPATTGTLISTGDTGSVTSAMLTDLTIVNADISNSAAIATSKLASNTISGIYLGNNLNALTIGNGLTGSSYNGQYANTITIDGIVTTNTNVQTLTNKTLTSAVHDGTTTTFTNSTQATNYSTAPVTFSGGVGVAKSLYIGGDISITGNIYIAGNTTTISGNNIVIDDSIIYIANNNPANLNDIGLVGHFTSGTYQHTGLVRDATDGIWKLFSGVTTEATNTVDFTSAVYDTFQAGSLISTVTTGTSPITIASTTLVANLNVDFLDGQHGSYYTAGSNITGTIPSAILGNSTVYIGTTGVALNRTTGAQSLTGVNIDGSSVIATNLLSGTLGSIPYQTAANSTSQLAGNITATKNFLSQTGTGAVSAAPTWSTVTKTDVGLSAVENTALSTWAGSTNLITLGTVTSGTWNGTAIAVANGGTGATSSTTARTNLGLAIGTNVQAWNANLDNIVLNTSSGFLKKTGISTWAIDTATYLTAEADTLQTVTTRGSTTTTTLATTNATDATNLSTAALLVSGGASITKSLLVAGDIIGANTIGTIITKDTVVQTSLATQASTAVDSWPIATFRSAKYLVQITQGTNFQVSEILVIHNGTTTTMTEFAAVETNGALATFTSSITGGTTANLLVAMGSLSAATINIKRTALVI